MYLMVGTRPDLAYSVGTLAKYVRNPTQLQWDAVKRMMHYVMQTKKVGLMFGCNAGVLEPMNVYIDSDWAGDVDTRRSMSGLGAMMCGSLVSWYARQQEVVANGIVTLEYCPTENMVADMFTKALGRVKLEYFVAIAGMREVECAETQ